MNQVTIDDVLISLGEAVVQGKVLLRANEKLINENMSLRTEIQRLKDQKKSENE